MSTTPNKYWNTWLPPSRRLLALGSGLLSVLVLLGTFLFAWAHLGTDTDVRTQSPGSSTPTSSSGALALLPPSPASFTQAQAFTPTRHSPGTPTPTPKPRSSIATTSTATGTAISFRFTAAGDYGKTVYTTANLDFIAHAGASFHLGLGDFNYDADITPEAWSDYAKSHLPANFPFEIVAGGHDQTQLDALAAYFPNRLRGVSGTYAREYMFDYPSTAPLARFILLSPSGVLDGYNYNVGSPRYNWVAQQIDAARASHIPWVIVGMHQYCFVIDSYVCPAQDLLDLLLNKKVDLILQAQKHTYQASKQLRLDGATCPALPITSYNPACVVSSSTSLSKGAGSVIVVTGTGGTTPLLNIDTTDPKISYFRAWMGNNVSPTWGVSRFTVSAKQITAQFVGVSGGFSDSFTIHS